MLTRSIRVLVLSFDVHHILFLTSKLQTEVALSTTEAEYIAMSQALRGAILLVNLIREVDVILNLHIPKPKFIIKVHKYNQSCIAMAHNHF